MEVEERPNGKNKEIEIDLNINARVGTSRAPIVPEEAPDAAIIVEKPGKCWADYRDGEVELVEVLS